MQDVLNQFVDQLVSDKGLTGLDDEVMNQLKADLKNRVEDRVNAAILDKLPVEKVEEFEKILDSEASDEQVQQFCKANIADLDSLVASALLDFRNSYLNL